MVQYFDVDDFDVLNVLDKFKLSSMFSSLVQEVDKYKNIKKYLFNNTLRKSSPNQIWKLDILNNFKQNTPCNRRPNKPLTQTTHC